MSDRLIAFHQPRANAVGAALGQNRVFRDLPQQDIRQLASALYLRSISKNVTLFGPGDPADTIYFVEHGFVRLHRSTIEGRALTVAIAGAGDLFGEGALLDGSERTGSASTTSPASLWVGCATRFLALMRTSPSLTFRITREVLRLRDELEAHLAFSTYAPSRSRVELALLRLAEAHGVRLADGAIWTPIAWTHWQIAELAGTARETASVQLALLKREGLLRMARDGSFFLRDVQRMASRTLGRPFQLRVDQSVQPSANGVAVAKNL